MLTICIPVYNFDVTSLVKELYNQAELLKIQYEIVIIDDCSKRCKEINRNVCKEFNYVELSENIGRAKIRNLFLKYAKYDYLLFFDCDSLVESPKFLLKYVQTIEKFPDVVCGGRIYHKHRPKRNKMLRWKYGIFKESKSCEERQKSPNKSFMTNNFLIKRNILKTFKFDERIAQYGHEDTLFGIALKKNNIEITHINNPVVNGDVEFNKEYLKKTKESIINLINILKFVKNENDLINDITLLKFFYRIKKIRVIIYILFVLLKPFMKFFLTKGYISLFLFDFYKLGFFIEKYKNDF